jgi:hypothetical protein
MWVICNQHQWSSSSKIEQQQVNFFSGAIGNCMKYVSTFFRPFMGIRGRNSVSQGHKKNIYIIDLLFCALSTFFFFLHLPITFCNWIARSFKNSGKTSKANSDQLRNDCTLLKFQSVFVLTVLLSLPTQLMTCLPITQSIWRLEVGPSVCWSTNSWCLYSFLVWCQYFVFTLVLYIDSSDCTTHRCLLSKACQAHSLLYCWSADCALPPISIYFAISSH